MKEIKRPYRVKDLTGKRFGMLTVIGTDGYFCNKNGEPYRIAWKCLCDCGNYVRHNSSNLNSGEIKSCGCYMNKIRRTMNSTHGLSKTRIYDTYHSMLKRCFNEKEKCFYRYGGRGITVCPEWQGKNGFINFYNWSIANGYSDELTLDRIENDGNYEPSNCRWVSMAEQAQNKSNNVIALETGKSVSYENSLVGIVDEHVAVYRYSKYGWDLYDATHIPLLTKGTSKEKWIEKNPEYLKKKFAK